MSWLLFSMTCSKIVISRVNNMDRNIGNWYVILVDVYTLQLNTFYKCVNGLNNIMDMYLKQIFPGDLMPDQRFSFEVSCSVEDYSFKKQPNIRFILAFFYNSSDSFIRIQCQIFISRWSFHILKTLELKLPIKIYPSSYVHLPIRSDKIRV